MKCTVTTKNIICKNKHGKKRLPQLPKKTDLAWTKYACIWQRDSPNVIETLPVIQCTKSNNAISQASGSFFLRDP